MSSTPIDIVVLLLGLASFLLLPGIVRDLLLLLSAREVSAKVLIRTAYFVGLLVFNSFVILALLWISLKGD